MERSCLKATNLLIRVVSRVLALGSLLIRGWALTLLTLGGLSTFHQALASGMGLSQSDAALLHEYHEYHESPENHQSHENHEYKETFPESRFGSPPSRLDAEGRSRFVTNAMETLRQDESGGTQDTDDALVSNRRPAGLEFTQEAGRVGSAQAQPVIGEPGMPHSSANLNPKPESSTARTGIQEVAIIAGDLGFFPKAVFVTRNIPVRMYVTGAAKRNLCFMMDLDILKVRKQIRAQKIEELTFTPTQAGQFRYYCPINGMEGNLLVKEGNYAIQGTTHIKTHSTTLGVD